MHDCSGDCQPSGAPPWIALASSSRSSRCSWLLHMPCPPSNCTGSRELQICRSRAQRCCTLVVESSATGNSLPSEWELIWAADSCNIVPIAGSGCAPGVAQVGRASAAPTKHGQSPRTESRPSLARRAASRQTQHGTCSTCPPASELRVPSGRARSRGSRLLDRAAVWRRDIQWRVVRALPPVVRPRTSTVHQSTDYAVTDVDRRGAGRTADAEARGAKLSVGTVAGGRGAERYTRRRRARRRRGSGAGVRREAVERGGRVRACGTARGAGARVRSAELRGHLPRSPAE